MRLKSGVRKELNCIAQGRLGLYLPPDGAAASVFGSQRVVQVLQQRLRAPTLALSAFPLELRVYPPGSHMPWHKDEAMFATPQWEVIYTVGNTSDSETQWRDERGTVHSEWTLPNSLLAVEAEGWDHRVTPSRRGERTIVKLAYTATAEKLPAFDANLDRVAFAA